MNNELLQLRKFIFSDFSSFTYTDPKTETTSTEAIGVWAKRVSSSQKFSSFLIYLIDWLKADTILETGTASGINAIAMSYSQAKKIITVEGSKEIANIAQQNIAKYKREKIKIINENIYNCFPQLLEEHLPELIFLDADHRSETILWYMEKIRESSTAPKCVLIHDIYWSKDMLMAWKRIVADPKYSLTVDLFEVGLVFPNMDIEKQHFQIRF